VSRRMAWGSNLRLRRRAQGEGWAWRGRAEGFAEISDGGRRVGWVSGFEVLSLIWSLNLLISVFPSLDPGLSPSVTKVRMEHRCSDRFSPST